MKSTLSIIIGILLFFIPHNLKKLNEEQIADELIYIKGLPYDLVTVTTYTVAPNQTDSTPLITASGFKLDSLNPKKHKIIAVSRDLKKKYRFGEKVRIKGAGRLDGVYTIRDVMAKRWKKKIDILINPDDTHTKISGVQMYDLID